MNILEELRSLDPRDPGRWPLPVLAGAVAAAFLVLSGIGIYMLVWNEQRPRLEQFAAEEQKLRQEFRDKHSKAVNLELYKQQLKDIERSFGALLRQLPGKTEVPSLLVDISQTGLARTPTTSCPSSSRRRPIATWTRTRSPPPRPTRRNPPTGRRSPRADARTR
jgi:type IV pilus assembly protein PilO